MKRFLPPVACAAAILLSSVAIEAIASPAFAQMDDQVDFQTFHDVLASYGDWVYSDRWGEVWIPIDVPDDFQPYGSDGYWAYSDYGWTWVSGYDWGDIPFHYGRWVNDPDDGWLWIPGYVWSPAWVVWRSNGRYVGWMAMPPDEAFLGRGGPSVGISFGGGLNFSINFGSTRGYYGYSQWYGGGYDADRFASNWVFVDEGHMADRNFRHYQAPRSSYASLISHGRDITHYSVSNNYVVNRSIDPRAVQKAGGHAVPVVHLSQIMKRPQYVTTANQGQQTQSRMRSQTPRGTGVANSAPKPSATVVQSLSTNITAHNGRPTTHLFTRDTVTSAPLPVKPGGPVAPGATAQPSEITRHRDNTVSPTTNGPTAPATTPPSEFSRHRDNMTGPTTNGPSPAATTPPVHSQTVAPTGPAPGVSAPSAPTPSTDRMHRHDNQMTAPVPGTPTVPAPGVSMPSTTSPAPITDRVRQHDNQTTAPVTPTVPQTLPPHAFAPSPNAIGQGNGAPPPGGANGQGNSPPPRRFERANPVPPPTPAGGPPQGGGTAGSQSPPAPHNDFTRVRPVVTPPTAPTAPTTAVPARVTPPPPQAPTNPDKPEKKKPDDNGPPR